MISAIDADLEYAYIKGSKMSSSMRYTFQHKWIIPFTRLYKIEKKIL